MQALLALLLLGAVSAAAGPFAYDTSAPLDVKVTTQRTVSGVTISDVTFASTNGRRVHGELDVPLKRSAHSGAVLFVHWLGDPETTNLSEFRSDALQMAKAGAVTLSVDAMWSSPRWFTDGRSPETDYDNSIAQVFDLRRAIDMLLAQPGVDPSRLAYVGHDFGAMYGAVLSGIDARPQYYVLMAGTATFSEWYLLGKKPADTDGYCKKMSVLDPPHYLKQSSAKSFLFQFGSHDRYIKPDRADLLFDAAPAPKTMTVYPSGHSLDVPAAHADRIAWLSARIGA
jgi:dienelactone hydrolase